MSCAEIAKLKSVKNVDRNELAQVEVDGCIVALGSNYQAQKHLKQSRKQLEALAVEVVWSTEFVNPDYTATSLKPKPDYTNQCGYLKLNQPCVLQNLIQTSKQIEGSCERHVIELDNKSTSDKINKQVSIDIDILAVHMEDKWVIINQRYPFKAHEKVGLCELSQGLSQI